MIKRYLLLMAALLAVACGDDESVTQPGPEPTPVVGIDQSADGNGTSVISSGGLIQEFVPQTEVMNFVDIYRRTNLNVVDADVSIEVRSSSGWLLGTSRVVRLANGQIEEWIRMWFDHNVITMPGEMYTFTVVSTGGGFAVEWSQDPGLYPYGIVYAFGQPRETYDLKFRTGYDVLP